MNPICPLLLGRAGWTRSERWQSPYEWRLQGGYMPVTYNPLLLSRAGWTRSERWLGRTRERARSCEASHITLSATLGMTFMWRAQLCHAGHHAGWASRGVALGMTLLWRTTLCAIM